MIKSVSYSQEEIIKDIINLHLNGKDIECDPTYSKGNFYKNINKPVRRFDLVPQGDWVLQADCRNLPLQSQSTTSIMFDPPFVISKGPSLQQNVKGTNIISSRFSSFESPKKLWDFYEESLREFHRILKDKGVLIFKCQDTVSGGKQYLSHIFIINKAIEIGFYPKDLFILGAKNRLNSGKIKKQQHARKFHSYFLVFIKEKSKVNYETVPTTPKGDTRKRSKQASSKTGDAWEPEPVWLSNEMQPPRGLPPFDYEKDVLEGDSNRTSVVSEG